MGLSLVQELLNKLVGSARPSSRARGSASTSSRLRLVLLEPGDQPVDVEADVVAEFLVGDALRACLREQPRGGHAEELRGVLGVDERAACADAAGLL